MKGIIKITSFIAGCFFVFLLIIGSYSNWFDVFTSHIPSPFRYGDLYLASNMPGYRIEVKPIKLESPIHVKNRNYSLTIIGDSYLSDLDSTFFSAGDYRFIHWNDLPISISKLDRNKKNIVVMELAERFTRWRFNVDNILFIGKKIPKQKHSEIKLMAEDNLQFMLTHFDWELPFKELKTFIYLNWFNRCSPLISKPDDGRLYLKETVDPDSEYSSFNPVTDAEIDSIVANANKITDEMKACGFDEVYISIVPNPASIYKYSEKPYNHLIERIRDNMNARFKFIDIYQTFKEEHSSVFYNNDTHWNYLGKMEWVVKTNRDILLNSK